MDKIRGETMEFYMWRSLVRCKYNGRYKCDIAELELEEHSENTQLQNRGGFFLIKVPCPPQNQNITKM